MWEICTWMPFVSRVSFFAFPTKMSMPPFSAFCLWWEIIRSLPIGWHIYCTAYNTVQYVQYHEWRESTLFDIYFITLFFSTCQVRVKLVFVHSRLFLFIFYTLQCFSRTSRNQLRHQHISSHPAFHSVRRFKHRMFAAAWIYTCSLRAGVSPTVNGEGDVPSRGTFERYFINGEWNRQRGQKLTCYIVRTIHWTGQNTQHEPRNCTDLHSECTRAMRSQTTIVVVPRGLAILWKNTLCCELAPMFFPSLILIY